MMLLGPDDRARWLRVALATTHLPLKKVAEQLTQQRIRRVPVVNGQGQLIGIVSRRDVLRWAASRVPVVKG